MVRAVAFTLAVLALVAPARAQIELIGTAEIPGTARDLSGLGDKQLDGTPQNQLGGLSGIAYTGRGDEYVQIADRGPKDGAADFICRFHHTSIRVDPKANPPVAHKLTRTTLLTDEKKQPLLGLLDHPRRFDPEGIRVGRTGTVFISDEYGPFLCEFDLSGRRLRSLPVPARFLAAHPSAKPEDELPPKNIRGRIPNRGMEGLAISPDGSKLYGIMQSPLIQDGGLDPENKRIGRNIRILEVAIATGRTREFVYRLDSPANGVNEILAVNNHQFLVLERDSLGGSDTKCKMLVLIDLTAATDVSTIDRLPADELPPKIVPVQKTTFLDLLDSRYGIAGADCPEKFEGICFGPDLADGRRLLLVTADNDFIAEKPFRLFAFAVDAKSLPGYVPQQFDK